MQALFRIITIGLIVFAFISCKKQEDPVSNDTNTGNSEPIPEYITAGVWNDSNMYHQLYSSPLSVNLSWDSIHANKFGKLSLFLPVGTDDSVEFIFQTRVLYYDSSSLVSDSVLDYYSSYFCLKSNTLDVKFKGRIKTYYVGLGSSIDFSLLLPAELNELLVDTGFIKKSYMNFWTIAPRNDWYFGGKLFGFWLPRNDMHYIVFWLKGRMGWIKIHYPDFDHIDIWEYAIEKE